MGTILLFDYHGKGKGMCFTSPPSTGGNNLLLFSKKGLLFFKIVFCETGASGSRRGEGKKFGRGMASFAVREALPLLGGKERELSILSFCLNMGRAYAP